MAGWRELGPALLAALGLALVAAGAAVNAGGSLPAGQAENAPRSALRGGQVPPAANDAATLSAIEAAVRADAAQVWAGSDPQRLQLSSQAVTWADGSLGCPQPGLMYTQALVPGWRLVVREGGRELVYHAGRHGQWLGCPVGQARPSHPGGAPATS